METLLTPFNAGCIKNSPTKIKGEGYSHEGLIIKSETFLYDYFLPRPCHVRQRYRKWSMRIVNAVLRKSVRERKKDKYSATVLH